MSYLGFDPTTQSDGYFFVSYKRDDEDIIKPICESLDLGGLPMWNDYGVPYGDDWDETITVRIKNSDGMIVFISNNVFKTDSRYFFSEYSKAKHFNIKIVPIVLEPISEDDIPEKWISWWLEVKQVQYIDLSNNNYETSSVSDKIFQAINFKKNEPYKSEFKQTNKKSKHHIFRKNKSSIRKALLPRFIKNVYFASIIIIVIIIIITCSFFKSNQNTVTDEAQLYGTLTAANKENFLKGMKYQTIDYNNNQYEVSLLPFSIYIAGPNNENTILLSFIDRHNKIFSFYGEYHFIRDSGVLLITKGGENISDKEAAPIVNDMYFTFSLVNNGLKVSNNSLSRELEINTITGNELSLAGKVSEGSKTLENVKSCIISYDIKNKRTKKCIIMFTDGGNANSPIVSHFNRYTHDVVISWDSETHPYNDREIIDNTSKQLSFSIVSVSSLNFILRDNDDNYYTYNNEMTPIINLFPITGVMDKDTITCIGDVQAPAEDFVFPESSTEYLTEERIDNILVSSDREYMHTISQQAINEIYARYGYVFGVHSAGSIATTQYFREKEWYNECVDLCPSNDSLVLYEQYFNDYERANVMLINKWQMNHAVYY